MFSTTPDQHIRTWKTKILSDKTQPIILTITLIVRGHEQACFRVSSWEHHQLKPQRSLCSLVARSIDQRVYLSRASGIVRAVKTKPSLFLPFNEILPAPSASFGDRSLKEATTAALNTEISLIERVASLPSERSFLPTSLSNANERVSEFQWERNFEKTEKLVWPRIPICMPQR